MRIKLIILIMILLGAVRFHSLNEGFDLGHADGVAEQYLRERHVQHNHKPIGV